jgi:hypothetical protein
MALRLASEAKGGEEIGEEGSQTSIERFATGEGICYIDNKVV